MIVRLKTIKSRKRYLLLFVILSALSLSLISCHCNVHCIIRLLSQGQDLQMYQKRLIISRTSAHIVPPSDRPQAIKLLRKSLKDSSCAALVIVSLSKDSVTLPNLISLEYFVEDGCVHPLLVNFSYRRARQSASLMTDVYMYIRRRSTSLIDKSITGQDAKKKRSSYII